MAPPRRLRTCGVYIIRCATSGYVYVGSSLDCENRRRYYWSRLGMGGCHNKIIQYAYDVFGLDNLSFEIVEECSLDVLRDRELYWMKLQDQRKMFNILRDSRNIGPVSEETRAKLSARARAQHDSGTLGRKSWRPK